MKFDDILYRIGEFGKYQKRLYFLLCLQGIICGLFMMQLVVVMETPAHRRTSFDTSHRKWYWVVEGREIFNDYEDWKKKSIFLLNSWRWHGAKRCKIPGLASDTYAIQNEQHRRIIDLTIPRNDEGAYDKCSYYSFSNNVSDVIYSDVSSNITQLNGTRQKCTQWVYDKTMFKATYTSELNLVCDDSMMVSHARMIFYFGVLVGDLVFGSLSDKIGRKKALYFALLCLIAASFGVSWAPEFISFAILEFIIGASNHGMFICCNVLGQEMVGPSKRKYTGTIMHMFFSVGLMYQSLLIYFLRDWHLSDIAFAASCLIFLPYWWLIPESPRWLISQGRHDEASAIIQKAAEVNGTKVSGDLVHTMTIDQEKSGHVIDLFKSRTIFLRTVILNFNWMVVCMMYYGVTMHAGNIGDFYLNFFLMGVVEFPGIILTVLLIDRIGRKKFHFACMLTGGTACLCTIFTVLFAKEKLQPLTVTLAVIGKMGSSAAFVVVFIFAVELYPTVIRNVALGFGSCFARIGSMISPYCAAAGMTVGGSFGEALPLVIFGAASVVAGLLCLYLPETLNQKLPETIEDGINFGRSRRKIMKDQNRIDDTQEDLLDNNQEKSMPI